MSFQTILGITLLLSMVGIFIGLFIRIIRLKGNSKDIISIYILCIKFLIIYPMFFPIYVYKNKKAFIRIMAYGIYKNMKNSYGERKINKKRIEFNLYKKLTIFKIMSIWIAFMKSINKDFDNYIEKNILLAIELSESSKKFLYQKYAKPNMSVCENYIIEKEQELCCC